VTDKLCSQQKKVFGDPDDHAKKGGLKKMGEALDRGVVLVLSLWDDYMTGMDWLDETTKSNGLPGNKRGPCPHGSGKPADLRANHPDASVKYGNIKYGEIGSTVPGLPPATSGPLPPGLLRVYDKSTGASLEDTRHEDTRHDHLPLVAGAAFAGAGFVALIAAGVIALRGRQAQRTPLPSYEQLSGATTPMKLTTTAEPPPDAASETLLKLGGQHNEENLIV